MISLMLKFAIALVYNMIDLAPKWITLQLFDHYTTMFYTSRHFIDSILQSISEILFLCPNSCLENSTKPRFYGPNVNVLTMLWIYIQVPPPAGIKWVLCWMLIASIKMATLQWYSNISAITGTDNFIVLAKSLSALLLISMIICTNLFNYLSHK